MVIWGVPTLTAQMTRLPSAVFAAVAAARPRRSQTSVGAGSQKLMLLLVWAFEGEAVTAREYSDLSGMSEVNVSRSLAVLEQLGLITSVRAGRQTKAYRLSVPRLAAVRMDDIAPPADLFLPPGRSPDKEPTNGC